LRAGSWQLLDEIIWARLYKSVASILISYARQAAKGGRLMNASVAKLERRNQLKTLQLLCQPFSPCRGCRSFGCHNDKNGLSIQDRHIEIIDAYATLTL